MLAIYSGIAQYHNLRSLVIELLQDGENFSSRVIEKFHQLTGTKPADTLYKRTVSTLLQ
jgi:hypothetical protein